MPYPYSPVNPWAPPSAYTPMQTTVSAVSSTPIPQQVVRVNGKNGAEAYTLAPNSSILLLDETAPIVWLKQTDGAGYATITAYNISPVEAQSSQTIDISPLENRLAALENRFSNMEKKVNRYGKSNSSNTRSNRASNSTDGSVESD